MSARESLRVKNIITEFVFFINMNLIPSALLVIMVVGNNLLRIVEWNFKIRKEEISNDKF